MKLITKRQARTRRAAAAAVGTTITVITTSAAAVLLNAPTVAAATPTALGALSPQLTGQQLRAIANYSTDPGVTHPNADFMGSTLREHLRGGITDLGRVALGGARVVTEQAEPRMAAVQTPGLDVSSWQGNVDWAAVKAAGAKFSYAKATEGTGYVNPYFANQYNGPYQQGIIRGAYHFALPDQSSGAAQADYFVAHGGGWSADGMTLPGALDIEWNPYGADCYGLSQDGMVAWIRSFSNEYLAKTGRWPVIYTNTNWWAECTGNRGDFSSTNPLWVANYGPSPGPMPYRWAYPTIWQFADSGTFPGDQNKFNGDFARLRALAMG